MDRRQKVEAHSRRTAETQGHTHHVRDNLVEPAHLPKARRVLPPPPALLHRRRAPRQDHETARPFLPDRHLHRLVRVATTGGCDGGEQGVAPDSRVRAAHRRAPAEHHREEPRRDCLVELQSPPHRHHTRRRTEFRGEGLQCVAWGFELGLRGWGGAVGLEEDLVGLLEGDHQEIVGQHLDALDLVRPTTVSRRSIGCDRKSVAQQARHAK